MNNIFTKIKNKWSNYLANLAKANEKSFGSQRLNCCDLHRDQKEPNNLKK